MTVLEPPTTAGQLSLAVSRFYCPAWVFAELLHIASVHQPLVTTGGYLLVQVLSPALEPSKRSAFSSWIPLSSFSLNDSYGDEVGQDYMQEELDINDGTDCC